jgi:transposase
VALEQNSVCVVDWTGRIVREARVASEPEALTRFLGRHGLVVTRIGVEAGPLSQWLHAGLTQAGFEVVLLETRQVKAALSAMVVKTDRKDARGIAQLLRMGWFRPVHCKSPRAQEVRALLVGRKLLQGKLLDVELSIRGILRGFGLKVGVVSKGRFAIRIRELVTGQAMLERVIEPMLRAREALRAEYHALHRAMLGIVREDTTCRWLMTVPGSALWWRSRSPRRSTTRAGLRDPERWALTSASRRRNTSPARSTSPAGSARWATPWFGAPSMRPPT